LLSQLSILIAVTISLSAQSEPIAQLPVADKARVQEFYRLSAAIQDEIWKGWSSAPDPLLLVTDKAEFLTHYSSPPSEFKKISQDWHVRPKQFPVNFQATFPAFGPPSVIVIGESANTQSATSTPWVFTLMHKHFHQLQNAQPNYVEGVKALGLSGDDNWDVDAELSLSLRKAGGRASLRAIARPITDCACGTRRCSI
jgi:hypothetical protein